MRSRRRSNAPGRRWRGLSPAARRFRLLAAGLLLILSGCDAPAPPPSETTPAARSSAAKEPSDSAPAAAVAGLGFREVSSVAGLTAPQLSGDEPPRTILGVKSIGAALIDHDADGDLDLFLTSGSTPQRWAEGEAGFPCRLYRNDGGLRFAEVEDRAGLPLLRWATGVAVADLDGDGREDLLVTGFGEDRIFLNRARGFEEVEASGLARGGWSTSAAFADLDGDGVLDLFIARNLELNPAAPPVHGEGWSCLWEGQVVVCGPRGLPPLGDRVYRGLGDGRFEEVTSAWGFDAATPGYGLAVVIEDLLGDATPEVFVANDSSANHLWTRREGRWIEVGFRSGVAFDANGEEQAGMGADVGDVDGDGRPDLVVTNFEREAENLYIAAPTGHFFDRSDSWGVATASRATLSWGIGLEDFDLDGDLDLFVSNGHVYPEADRVPTSPGHAQRPQLYRQDRDPRGNPRFVECGEDAGFVGAVVGRGALFGDLDGDGDVDIIQSCRGAPPRIYENLAARGGGSIAIRLRQGAPGNRDAIGSRVEVETISGRWVDSIRRQSSFQSSGDPRLFRGHPRGEPAVVRVRWPDGAQERFDLPADPGAVTLERGRGRPEGPGPSGD